MKANQNIFVSSLKLIFIDFAGDFFYFPIWWYTKGLKKAFFWFLNTVKDLEYRLAVGIWIKNLLVPMFGQTDWQGRLISVFMRIVQIIFRSAALVALTGCVFMIFLLLIFIPVFVAYGLIMNTAEIFD